MTETDDSAIDDLITRTADADLDAEYYSGSVRRSYQTLKNSWSMLEESRRLLLHTDKLLRRRSSSSPSYKL